MAGLYGKPQGFLDDYSGVAALGSAFEGALKGMQAADDQKMKKMEFEAKIKSDRDKAQRDAEEMAIKKRKESPEMLEREEVMKASGQNQDIIYGDVDPKTGLRKIEGTKYKPEYVQMQKDRAFMDPFGAKKLNAENAAKPKEYELTAGGFARRMEGAENKFNTLMQTGFDPTTLGVQAQQALGGPLEGIKDPKVKQYQQIVKDFASAILRKESGAAISKQEYSDVDKMYFPQVGDTPEVLAQKAASRNQSFQNFKTQSGKAFDLIPAVQVIPPQGLMKPGMMKGGLVKPPSPGELEAKKKRLAELKAKAAGG